MMVNGLATVAKKIRKLETITRASVLSKTDILSQADVKKEIIVKVSIRQPTGPILKHSLRDGFEIK